MSYNFRLRFLVPEDNRLSCNQEEIELKGNRTYVLKSETHNPIKNSSALVILGSGYPTEDDARREGLLARSALLFASAGSRLGVDCGHDKPIGWIAEDLRREMEKQQHCKILNSVHGLLVYEDPGNARFVAVNAKAEVLRGLENFSGAFLDFLRCAPQLIPRELIALELLNAFNFEASSRAQLIISMTSIEVLSEPIKRPKNFQLIIDHLLERVETLDCSAADKGILRNGISRLKGESIRNSCKTTVAKVLDDEASIEFDFLYKLRNDIVHHGKRAENVDAAALKAYNLAWRVFQKRIGLTHPAQ